MTKTIAPILIIATLAVTAGILMFVHHGYKPQPVRVLNPSTFARPQEAGVALAKRFYTEASSAKLVILGESPEIKNAVQVWDGFIEEAAKNGTVFDQILTHPTLIEIEAAMKTSKRLLVRAVTTDEAIAQFERAGWPGLYLHQAMFLPNIDVEKSAPYVCESEEDTQLKCETFTISKKYRRKKFLPGRLIGVMEKTYPSQYVLYLHEPNGL